MGWVSILDPDHVTAILDIPPHWRLVGYFCLGWPAENHVVPELEREGWETRQRPVHLLR
ncbi:5,6-dimethylbenzimidazole synthase [Methylobrevis pamukkalensis]|uniref:5,6-dimethylbenzimidazole synthase n=1 Tax=Methylobrevis pamukkalensis TaxID=1439726 RepID=A0A1E3H1N3_9HYPH|nr:5,6-dimethylbenzimidazole synthase [Methylobrevis pamukkalensis]